VTVLAVERIRSGHSLQSAQDFLLVFARRARVAVVVLAVSVGGIGAASAQSRPASGLISVRVTESGTRVVAQPVKKSLLQFIKQLQSLPKNYKLCNTPCRLKITNIRAGIRKLTVTVDSVAKATGFDGSATGAELDAGLNQPRLLSEKQLLNQLGQALASEGANLPRVALKLVRLVKEIVNTLPEPTGRIPDCTLSSSPAPYPDAPYRITVQGCNQPVTGIRFEGPGPISGFGNSFLSTGGAQTGVNFATGPLPSTGTATLNAPAGGQIEWDFSGSLTPGDRMLIDIWSGSKLNDRFTVPVPTPAPAQPGQTGAAIFDINGATLFVGGPGLTTTVNLVTFTFPTAETLVSADVVNLQVGHTADVSCTGSGTTKFYCSGFTLTGKDPSVALRVSYNSALAKGNKVDVTVYTSDNHYQIFPYLIAKL
jgi:hypothetical protein